MAQMRPRIVRRRNPPEHVMQVSGDGAFVDRMDDLAVFDPMTRDAARVVARGRVDRRAKEARHDQARPHFGNQLITRAASLSQRNIAITGPYMHDGRFATLSEVIDHYSTGIKSHPNLASELRSPTGGARQMNFSATDKENLIAFLNTLTDDEFKVDERFANPFK